ncbi:MAG: CxxxxCH/CxxCH domain c-type cytochrome [Desulfuromonadaceae bacterium]
MKQPTSQTVTSRVLLTLTLAIAGLAGLTGIAEAATCLTCHAPVGSTTDIRPVESTYRNITTGSIRGSHAKHIPAATINANTCTPCHGPLIVSTNHRSGFINVTSATAPGLSYSKGASFAQSGANNLTLGTCSTASCHANVYASGTMTTPVWGNAAANCTACHTTPIGANGPVTGSHTNTAGHAVSCVFCHAAGTTSTATPTVGHNDGNIDVANVGYATLDKAKGTAGTTCSAASCHASPVAASLVTTPAWGTTGNGCAACHIGVNAITASGPATGNHALAGHAAACTACHATGTTDTAVPTTGHNDGNIDVANVGYATLNKVKGSAGTTCSAASCHASPVAASLVITPAWGTTGNGCAACHTGANLIIANGPATGSHGIVGGGHNVACTSCHAASTTQTVAPTAGHADGDIDVANVGYATLNKVKGSVGVTCSAASCHVSPVSTAFVVTPAWGTTGNGCAACHTGTNLIVANGPATGSHGIVGGGHNVACTSCHAAGTTQTVAPTAGHADGDIDVANVGYASLNKVKGSAGATCSAASCHISPVSTAFVVTPAWASTGNGCAACHTGANLITASGPATGSHAKHSTAACTACHTAGTTATVAPGTGHNDGNIDVANVGYATLNKIKGTAGVSCSTSVCHGTTSPAWGTTGTLPTNDMCTTCHGTETAVVTAANRVVVAPSDAAGTGTGKVSANAKTGAHETHLKFLNNLSAQGTQDSRCNDCHGALPVSGSHANGSSTPVFQGLATNNGAMTGASFSGGSCSSTYCHNPAVAVGGTLNTANAGTGVTPSWTNANYIADGTLKTQANCGTCHKSPGDAGFTAAVDHGTTAMPLGIGTDCTACHGHNGGTGGAAGQQHMDGIKFGNGSCDACHGYPPLTAAQFSARGANYVNAKVEDYAGGAGHHQTHLLASVKASEGFTPCLPCHPSAFHNGGNGTVSKLFVNVNDAADTTFRFDESRAKRYTVAAQTCSNVSCHFQPTPGWTFGL